MKTTRSKIKITIAALLIYSTLQISGQIALAEPSSSVTKASVPVQLIGRLTTRSNKPITVNGLSAATGASIATGATIETRSDESASVDLGPLGRLDISPNTKVVLTFDQAGDAKALVMFGCVILTANKGTRGEVSTEKGVVGTTDPAVGGVIEMCMPPGAASPTVGPGVAQGAGAGSADIATTGGGGLWGIGRAATIAIFTGAGIVALTPLLFFEDNPSPS